MTLNVAIAGPGNIAHHCLAPALSKVRGAVFWSVLSRDSKRALNFAKTHGAKAPNPTPVDLKAMLEDPDLDAIVIATPDKLHADQTIACAKAGKHVLVEKPMATDVSSARAMVQACETAKTCLAVAYHLRWHDGHRMLVAAIRKGKLGNLRHMRVHWTWNAGDASNWRASEEVGQWWSLAGVGTHCLDMIRWIMVPTCGEIVSIKSLISKHVWGGPHDETATVSILFESGATAEFYSSALFDSPCHVEIYGDRGYALCDETLGRQGKGIVQINGKPMKFRFMNPYEGEIRDFISSIIEKRPPEVDGIEGFHNVELLERISTNSNG